MNGGALLTFRLALAGLLLATIVFCGGAGGGTGGGGSGGGNQGLRGVYVADTGNHRITVHATGSSQFFHFGSQGSGIGQFNGPNSVVVDRNGRIYVADTGNHRIVRMNDISGAGWVSYGTQGSGQGQFNTPMALSLAFPGGLGETHLLICDTENDRIVRLSTALDGQDWETLGTNGSGNLQFDDPQGISVSGDHIYVADTANHRIVRVDNMTGAGWTSAGTLGAGQLQFTNPRGIHFGRPTDLAPRLYVADSGNHRIVALTAALNWGEALGSIGSGTGQFVGPSGVFHTEGLRILVADQQNHRIVSMENMAGAGWSTTGAQGSGDLQWQYPSGIARHETTPNP